MCHDAVLKLSCHHAQQIVPMFYFYPFSRVLVDDKNREPEVSCVDNFGKAAGMGLLEGGMMIQVCQSAVRLWLRVSLATLSF